MNKTEYYNRTCKHPDCNEVMGDLSWRAYCNDHLAAVLENSADFQRETMNPKLYLSIVSIVPYGRDYDH